MSDARRVDVIIPTAEMPDLEREIWGLMVSVSGITVRFTGYESRPSKRHKWHRVIRDFMNTRSRQEFNGQIPDHILQMAVKKVVSEMLETPKTIYLGYPHTDCEAKQPKFTPSKENL